jgi:L-ribulose-5-phosphate 3-epimerase UlaE
MFSVLGLLNKTRTEILKLIIYYGNFTKPYMRVYPKISGLAAWSENCKWYSSVLFGTVESLFCESVQ